MSTLDSAATPLNVLVVDDDVDGADTLAVLLSLHGHSVRVARNGEEALRHTAIELPDVILLDLRMAGIDGCEVARRIRSQSHEAKPPLLVAITGCDQDSDRQLSAEAGIHLHLLKPVDPILLSELLEQHRSQRCNGAVAAAVAQH